MDWTNIVITLITSGAFTTIYLLGDKKTAQVLANVSKMVDQWRDLLAEVRGELGEQRNEFRQAKSEYEEKLLAKDRKIDSQYREMSVLRDKNDKLSSNVARLNIVKCWDLPCGKREPPMKNAAQRCLEDPKNTEELIKTE